MKMISDCRSNNNDLVDFLVSFVKSFFKGFFLQKDRSSSVAINFGISIFQLDN